MAFLARRNNGVEGPAPGTAQNINRGCRIRASGYGPHDFIQIRDVDVLVYHHNVTTQIGTGMALASNKSSLFRVARVALFDRDDNHESLRWRRQINTTNVGNASLLHSVPYCGCPQTRPIHTVNGWLERRSATNNRIVAIVKSLHSHERLGAASACVIARPFAKRAFGQRVPGDDFSFDGDFSCGWKTVPG